MERDEILDSVTELAQEKGWEKTSVREISRKIGYSTIKIYSEFGNKNVILQELQKRGFSLLQNTYEQALKKGNTPISKLEAVSLAHYRFAFIHKNYYDLMFQMNGVSCSAVDEQILVKASASIRALLAEVHGELTREVFTYWWALVHGFVAISISNQCLRLEEGEALMKPILQRFTKSLVNN